ncbi:MAG: cytochrome b5 domain-containing protein [Oligoflexus sp.]
MKRHVFLLAMMLTGWNNTAQAEAQKITKQELASHKTPEDCWMAIDGFVYNMSDYMKLHAEKCKEMQLNDYCGKDASEVWKKAEDKHKRKSLMQLERAKKGELAAS